MSDFNGSEPTPHRAMDGADDTEEQLACETSWLSRGTMLSERMVIGELLGKGGMGWVYAAHDTLKQQDVALKVLRPRLAANQQARERFLAEARICCALSHPNIVRVYDAAEHGGEHIYFTMELLKGQSLRTLLEQHKRAYLMPLDEATEIAHRLIDALIYAHGEHVVHRDIKPENIWLCAGAGRTVKLMDFGIARARTSTLTQTGMVLGTMRYAAPEQRASARAADWSADQYSLARVVYEMLCGVLPEDAALPLEQLRRDVPKRYARALRRALSHRPEERWPSLQGLRAELQLPRRRPMKSAVAGLGLAIALVGAGVYWWRQPTKLAIAELPATLTLMPDPDPPTSLSTFRDRLSSGGEGPAMVVIPSGEFVMGSPENETGRKTDESPQHPVRIAQFALGLTEVTFDEYDRFARAQGRPLPDDGGWGRGAQPVINVSWRAAADYAVWLSEQTSASYRLPSEAEWEYAARAGRSSPFGTGSCLTTAQANFDGGPAYDKCPGSSSYLGRPQSVGRYPANAFNVQDMHGNVWEWVQDCYHDTYTRARADGSPIPDQSTRDCAFRVLRGGSWVNGAQFVRAANREWRAAGAANAIGGFRVARAL